MPPAPASAFRSSVNVSNSSNFGDYQNFGIYPGASFGLNAVRTATGQVVDHYSPASRFGRVFGGGFTVATGLVDVVVAARHGPSRDVVVQVSGIGGALAGAYTRAKLGGLLGAAFGPPGITIGSFLEAVAGGYFGEDYTQTAIDFLSQPRTVEAIMEYGQSLRDSFDITDGGGGGWCFPAGTSISLPNDEHPQIENIRAGQGVVCHDACGKTQTGRVTRTFENITTEMLLLNVTTVSKLKATDHLMRLAGAKCIGGGYLV